MDISTRPIKTFSSYKKHDFPFGDLLDFQRKSYNQFLEKDFEKLFKDFFPIKDSNDRFLLEYISYSIEEPKHTPNVCRDRYIDYIAQLKVRFRLTNNVTGTKKEEEVIFADVPVMTNQGSFIINGKERTVVSQIVKSNGIRFEKQKTVPPMFGAKVQPKQGRGMWIVFETDRAGNIHVRLDQNTKKVPVTTFLRLFGPQTKEDVLKLFKDDEKALEVIKKTFAVDKAGIMDEVYLALYKAVRNDIVSADKAKGFLEMRFSKDMYDISEFGRLTFNKRFGLPTDKNAIAKLEITLEDIVIIIKEIVRLNTTPNAVGDDIDHLGHRRVRTVGELIYEFARKKFAGLVADSRRRMLTRDPTIIKNPTDVINLRMFKHAPQAFFTQNQLSQLLSQYNVMDELSNFRIISALGSGGVARERAGIDVRDIHPSHYGRICPVHTPEGANVGLVLQLALYARMNEYGLLEVPYRKVIDGKVTDTIEYLDATEEERFYIAPADIPTNEKQEITKNSVGVRYNRETAFVSPKEVNYVDVDNGTIFSVATALIPFVSSNIVVRTLYGSTFPRKSVPCVFPEMPMVSTGFEETFARATGRLVIAEEDGEVIAVDATHIITKTSKKEKRYDLEVFTTTNGKVFSSHQRPIVSLGQKIKKGDVLADVASSDNGHLALGKNVRVAFSCYFGGNFEDAILISRRLVENDTFTSITVGEFSTKIRETKLGPEVISADIPNVSEKKLRNLDSTGIVRVGAEVSPGDILVGKITPRGESLLSPEERLLQSIFGDKAKEVKDSSLKLSSGHKGRVIGVKIRDRADGHELEPGVIKEVIVTIAQLRRIQEGDKFCNRYGNKGVISRVLAVEDMPFTEDGEPVDIVLSPLGVPSRVNLGQILELHLGLAAEKLGYRIIAPPLTGVKEEELREELKKAGLPESGKVPLYNGRTGNKMANDVAVGWMYIFKLDHMVDDKIHARSTGDYSLITQQPIGGRSRGGGQRVGEMEVWALLAHGVSYALREILTIKSDDVFGRSAAYSSIIRNDPIVQTGTPAAFNVLIHQLRGLGLQVTFNSAEDEEYQKLKKYSSNKK